MNATATPDKQLDVEYSRCRTVYRRPCLKWHVLKEPNVNSHNQRDINQ